MKLFPNEVSTKLKFYVYRLIDPRNGETFYVGKGKNNRVFEHAKANIESTDPSEKLKRIHEIHANGFEVAHVIHRHGLDAKTALEVEAALIDAYPGLTNIAPGSGSNEFGAMHAREVTAKYQAEPADFIHTAVIINVNRSSAETTLYEATRYAWKLNPKKADKADVIIAVRFGLIVAVFVATQWLPATEENFPGREPYPGRYGFVGRDADKTIWRRYVGKALPEKFKKKGAANPIKYSF